MSNRIMQARVEAGAKLLDAEYPGWYNEIDLQRLNLSDPRNCPVGQLYGSFSEGLDELEIEDYASIYGLAMEDDTYSWKELDEEWEKVIKDRRGDNKNTHWYIVLDGPFSVALMTTNEVEAEAFASGLTHAGVENTLVEKKVYNA